LRSGICAGSKVKDLALRKSGEEFGVPLTQRNEIIAGKKVGLGHS